MPRSRSALKSLAATLDRSGALVALFDEQRQLIYASAACAAVLGIEVEQLVGRTVTFASEPQSDSAESAANLLAPPPDAFAGVSSETTLTLGDHPRRVRFLPLALGDDEWAVLMIADDEAEPLPVASASSDWHAALVQIRAGLPMSMQSEFLLGDHPLMRRLREQVQLAAKAKARVVVIGPRGSGTEGIATVIHVLSGGRNDGLIPLNCAVQDAETLQSAIRALSRKNVGRSHAPSPGPALLLRDVPRLPTDAQRELLGFLQLPGFDLRILATSRSSLLALAKKERFSTDLSALLGTLELRVPPLKERLQDVPLLAQALLERSNLQGPRQFRGFVPEAIERLVAYDWPENIEELRTTIEQTVSRAAGPWILATDLPERLRSNWQDLAHPRRVAEPIDLDAYLAEVETNLLSRTLTQTKGNKAEAARLLGISRPRLLRRLVQLKLVASEDAIDFQPLDDAPSQEAS